jgi:succinoglycan biosynthesis transport protein ExoP
MIDEFSLQHGPRRSWTAGDAPEYGDTHWDLESEQTASDASPKRSSIAPDAPDVLQQSAINHGAPHWPGNGMPEEDQELGEGLGIDIKALALGCWHRRYLIAAITAVISALFFIAAFTLVEHSWTATTILIKRDNSDEFAIGEGKGLKTQDYTLQTLLDTLKLPSSLDEVILRSNIDVPRTSFASAIDFKLSSKSDILQLSSTWKDPANAALIVNNLADVYLERSIEIQRKDAADGFDYYSTRLDDSRAKVLELDSAILDFQQQHKLSDFDAETKAILGALANLDADYEAQKYQADAIQISIARVQAEILAQPEMVIKSTIYRSPLKQRLTDYEWELREARSRYTPENPKVLKLQQKINVLDRMIGDSNDESVPENAYAPNAHREDLQLHLQELLDQFRIAEAKALGLDTTIKAMREKLGFLNIVEKQYSGLRSKHKSAKKLESSLLARVEEARVQMLRTEPAFDILERATTIDQPNPSGRKLIVAGGTVVAAGIGILIALLLQLLDPFVRSRKDGLRLCGVDLCLELVAQDYPEQPELAIVSSNTAAASLFRQLTNDLDSRYSAQELHSLAFVSADAVNARSLVAKSMGLALASKETATVLVNADFHAPETAIAGSAHAAEIKTEGLIDVLEHGFEVPEVLQQTACQHLQLLATGQVKDPLQYQMAIGSKRMAHLIETLDQAPQRVIYDLPPLSGQETAMEAAAAVGSVILVMHSGRCRRKQVASLVAKLKQRRVKVIAAVVTDVPNNYLEERVAERSDTTWMNPLRKLWSDGNAAQQT